MLDALTGTLEGGRPVLSRTIGTWVAESEIAEFLGETERAHEGVAIGSYPFSATAAPARTSWSARPSRRCSTRAETR